MNEDDIIKDLFHKADLEYQFESMEEQILQTIRQQKKYHRQKIRYKIAGTIGFVCFMVLCSLFLLLTGEPTFQNIEHTFYILIGIPFILLLLLIQLEVFLPKNSTSQTIL